jgi:hypothetical protein
VISALPIPQSRTGFVTFRTEDKTEDWRQRRPTQVTIPENVDVIHSMILDNQRISAKRYQKPWQYPEKDRLYSHDSRDFRNEKGLGQMGFRTSQCWSEAWSSTRFTSYFGLISVGSHNYGWNLDPYTWSRDQRTIQGLETRCVFWDKDAILPVDYLEKGAIIMASLQKESCFFKTILLHQKLVDLHFEVLKHPDLTFRLPLS